MTPIRTTCAYCGVGCGIRATVTGDRTVQIEGDPDHPANRGRLCSRAHTSAKRSASKVACLPR